MPRKRKKELIQCQHYRWLVGQRNGVFFADGRSNAQGLGRHSLGTKDQSQALEELKQLDLVMAEKTGRIPPAAASATAAPSVNGTRQSLLDLEVGRQVYIAYVNRPAPLGGAKPGTAQRYKAVFDKFLPFLRARGIEHWNSVDEQSVGAYAEWLDKKDYATDTLYFEITTIKQTIGWLILDGRLPEGSAVHLRVHRSEATNRYCWRQEEVAAMLGHCFADPKLHWLGFVLLGLATTGLRIGELADLRWTDLDLEAGILRLPDRRLHAVRSKRHLARSTKGRRGRSLHIHDQLQVALLRLKRHTDGYIFRAACGGKLDPDKVRKALIRDVQATLSVRFPKVGDEPAFEDGTPHSFRHFFISTAANNNVPERVVQEWLGHRASKMVAWYYHLHSEQSKEQMKKMSKAAETAGATWLRLLPLNNEGSTPGQETEVTTPEKLVNG